MLLGILNDGGRRMLYLAPTNDSECQLLERLLDSNDLVGFGRDADSNKMIHAQIALNPGPSRTIPFDC